MFKKFTKGCVNLVQRWLPDPFLFAVILTFIVLISGIIFTNQGLITMVGHWSKGFWSLLEFSMQMALVLVTGHTMASAKVFKKGLRALARIAKTPTRAIMIVTLVSTLACWVNWGFGLVIGAIFARELAKEVRGVDYRLLIASAYSGFLVWHAGISGSIPLKLASGGEGVVTATKGAVTEAISTTTTIFSPFNLLIVGILVITLPLVNRAMHPKKDDTFTIDPSLLKDVEESAAEIERTPANRIENSRIVSILVAGLGYIYIIMYFKDNGFKLNLNIVNFIFLFTAILLHGNPRRFLNAVQEAAKGTAGIILQFPFYGGIMGMMTGLTAVADGGLGISLAGQMSNFFVNISTVRSFPFFTFLSAGIVNFFVPSGGGQWAVQAPIIMPAAVKLGVPTAKAGMAIAWGDAWTNMIQPFWALPALGIAKLGAKDVMGYCIVDLIYSGVIIAVMLTIF